MASAEQIGKSDFTFNKELAKAVGAAEIVPFTLGSRTSHDTLDYSRTPDGENDSSPHFDHADHAVVAPGAKVGNGGNETPFVFLLDKTLQKDQMLLLLQTKIRIAL
ncbi:MAG: hypothetical protein ACREHC_02975 [Candidatus Levyibacteriota bacterium]